MNRRWIAAAVVALSVAHSTRAELPPNEKVQANKLAEVHAYCEGVVFDHAGKCYVSHGDRITQFTLNEKSEVTATNVWATTGAPNGHKILADGTHLVCDASRHAVLLLDAEGKFIKNASDICDGKLRGTPVGPGVRGEDIDLGVEAKSVNSFGQDAAHEVYVLSRDSGVLRIDPA